MDGSMTDKTLSWVRLALHNARLARQPWQATTTLVVVDLSKDRGI